MSYPPRITNIFLSYAGTQMRVRGSLWLSLTCSSRKLAICVWLLAAARCKGVMLWSSIIFNLIISLSSLCSSWTMSSDPWAHATWNAVLLLDSCSWSTDKWNQICLHWYCISTIQPERIFRSIIIILKDHRCRLRRQCHNYDDHQR